MDTVRIAELAARLNCPRADHSRYAADCVVRAIIADAALAPPPPWRIEAGVGVLTCGEGYELTFEPAARRSRLRLGDAVHAIAHPVAVGIDRIAGTNLRNCGGCAERRRRWNGEPPSP